jgi:hypothetical protein
MPFLRRRKSALIDGAADDARELSDHLASHLAGRQALAQSNFVRKPREWAEVGAHTGAEVMSG